MRRPSGRQPFLEEFSCHRSRCTRRRVARADSASSRRLRHEGSIPAVVYGEGVAPLSVAVNAKDFRTAVSGEQGLNSLITLDADGKKYTVLAREIQRHPVRGTVSHIDFQVVDPNQPVLAEVPLHLIGDAVEVRHADWEVDQQMFSIEVTRSSRARSPTSSKSTSRTSRSARTIRVGDLVLPEGRRGARDPSARGRGDPRRSHRPRRRGAVAERHGVVRRGASARSRERPTGRVEHLAHRRTRQSRATTSKGHVTTSAVTPCDSGRPTRWSAQLERRQRALSATLATSRGPVTLAVPTTFMNESGAALPPLLRRTSLDDLAAARRRARRARPRTGAAPAQVRRGTRRPQRTALDRPDARHPGLRPSARRHRQAADERSRAPTTCCSARPEATRGAWPPTSLAPPTPSRRAGLRLRRGPTARERIVSETKRTPSGPRASSRRRCASSIAEGSFAPSSYATPLAVASLRPRDDLHHRRHRDLERGRTRCATPSSRGSARTHVALWPGWDTHPLERVSPDSQVMAQRALVRWRIREGARTARSSSPRPDRSPRCSRPSRSACAVGAAPRERGRPRRVHRKDSSRRAIGASTSSSTAPRSRCAVASSTCGRRRATNRFAWTSSATRSNG